MSESAIARLREEANELLARGKYKRAYQRYQELRLAEPGNPDWALRVGELAVSLGEVEVAIESYRSAAEGYARRGQLVKAIAACKYVLDLDPSRTDVQSSLADLFARNAASPPRPRRAAPPPPPFGAPAPVREPVSAPERPSPSTLSPPPLPPAPPPSYDAPSYDAGSYAAAPPSYDQPSYEAPSYGQPSGYEAPSYGEQPGYDPSTYAAEPPAYDPNAYAAQPPAYDPNAYAAQPPAYDPGAYAEPPPAYDPYAAQPPAYDPGAYAEPPPAYDPNAYATPSPAYDPNAYAEPPPAYDPGAYAAPAAPEIPPAVEPKPSAAPPPPTPPPIPADAPLETMRLRDALSTRAPEVATNADEDEVIVQLDEAIAVEETEASLDELQQSATGLPVAAPPPTPELQEAAAVLPRVPLFSSLPRDALEELIGKLRLEKHKAGDVVIREGEPGDALYVVVSGLVEVTRGGASHVLARLGEGTFFGELALVTAEPRSATVTVVEPTELLVMSRTVMNQLIATYPDVLDAVLGFVRGRLVATLLISSPLFTMFDADDRKALAAEFELRELEAGAIIVREGQRADALHVLLAGQVGILREGQDEPVGYLGVGEVCGEQSLIGTKASATLRVERRTWTLALPRSRFQEVVLARPQMLEYLAEVAEQRKARLSLV